MAESPLILIVEDSTTLLAQIAGTLDQSGFRTRSAKTAFEAVGMARKETPDLILADVGLPDMDGATATSLLKDDPAFEKVPVVLISALPPEELKEKMTETGARDMLAKPFTTGDLIQCVRRCINSGGENASRS